jgi:hypothetical protein
LRPTPDCGGDAKSIDIPRDVNGTRFAMEQGSPALLAWSFPGPKEGLP